MSNVCEIPCSPLYCVVKNDKIISSFEIYHPKNTNHNQDVNHDHNKEWITFFLK
jgi:hypothetical protein